MPLLQVQESLVQQQEKSQTSEGTVCGTIIAASRKI
jgi:hypothetical protein